MSKRMSGLSLYADVRSHDSGDMSEQGVFWDAPYPLRKAEALLRSTFIVHSWAGAASPNSLLPV